MIYQIAQLLIREPDPATGKPYLEVTFLPDGPTVQLTTNLGEMIGGAAKGARERYEDLHP